MMESLIENIEWIVVIATVFILYRMEKIEKKLDKVLGIEEEEITDQTPSHDPLS